ncbi:hypothetical protein KAZ93_03320 [Patescibacteria group bacterium]|nr:hypothetical protein [Patescibacteria group bacterium]
MSRILSFPSQQIAGILKTIQTKATVTTSPAVATSSQNIDIHTIWQNRFPGQEAFISRVMAMKQSQKKPPLTSPVA